MKPFHFEASAKLQRLLGRELLPDDFSAIEELVKNAYDSNATEVLVRLQIQKSNSLILIRDNGWGLDADSFKRHWMWAGYSDKGPTPLAETGRIQTGEKGIGRFAADRLGKSLTVFTKTAEMDEALLVKFNWDKFKDQTKKLSDIKIPYRFVAPQMFGGAKTGTVLRIERLRAKWTQTEIEELRVRLARLISPESDADTFKIVLEVPTEDISGRLGAPQIEDPDFEWEVERDRGHYAVRGRRKIPDDVTGMRVWSDWTDDIEGVVPKSSTEDYGPIKARFFYFENRPRKGQVGAALPGVAVYRDGFRVEPDGTHAADWLGLLEKRAKRAGHMPLVPSRLFGFVTISRRQNPNLADATNRRAFVRGPAYSGFVEFLKARLKTFEEQLERDVAKPKWDRSKQQKAAKVAEAGHRTLSMLSLGLSHELRQPLAAIRVAAENVGVILKKQGFADPNLTQALDVIQRNVSRIDKQITFIKDLGVGKGEIETFRISAVVDEVLDAFKERARASDIQLKAHGDLETEITFSRWTLLMVLTNLVVNAYEAIRAAPAASGRRIDLVVRGSSKRVQIRVEDNGPGIPEATRARLFKRTTTSKQGGMGVALFIWRDVLRAFESDLSCDKFEGPTTFLISMPLKVTDGEDSAG